MKGHVYRRRRTDGSYTRWYAVIDLPPGPSGARRQKTTTHDTRREAQAWLAQTALDLHAGDVYDTRLTVGEFLLEWLDGKQALRPTTMLEYRRHVEQVFVPQLGHLRLLDLRAHHIEGVFARLRAGNAARERPISPQTMPRVLATIHSALNTAVRRGLIRRNPAGTVELARPEKTVGRVWDADEAAAFLTCTTCDPLHLLYRLMLITGMRRGEAVGLQWGDLDLDSATLTVTRQVINLRGDPIVGPLKSDAGHRTVALDLATCRLLRAQQRRARISRAWDQPADLDGSFVFARDSGEPYHPAYVSRHFRSLLKRHNLPPIRLHDLRHTSASLGLLGGESLLETSRRLGHSAIGITADVYAHVTPAQAAASTQRLAELLDRPPGPGEPTDPNAKETRPTEGTAP